MAKKHDLELQVDVLSNEIAQLKQQLEVYKGMESAIVRAMTDAQEASAKKIEQAQQDAKRIVDDADAYKREAEEQIQCARQQTENQTQTLVCDARETAEKTLAEAETKAQETLLEAKTQARALLEDAQQEAACLVIRQKEQSAQLQNRLDALAGELAAAAGQARAQAQAYEAALTLVEQNTAVLAAENRDIHTLLHTQPVETPDAYESPKDLMQGIYQVQGRELPTHVQAANEEAPPNEMPSQEEAALEASPLFAQEETPILEEASAWTAPSETAFIEDEQAQAEERVWTVDEIMAARTTSAPVTPPSDDIDEADLNSLLGDIMQDDA